MSFVQVGDAVREYYEEHCWDVGEVVAVDGHMITVDFYDWKKRWHDSDLRIIDLFYEGTEVLVPIHPGEIVVDFRLKD